MLRRAETPLGHPFQLRFLRPLRPPCHRHRRAGRERPSRTSWSGPVFAGGVMQLVRRYRLPVPSTFPTSSTSATSSAAVGSRPRRRHLLGDASRVSAPGILALSFCRIPSLSRASLGSGERRRYRISPYGRAPCLGNPYVSYVSYVSYVVGPEMSASPVSARRVRGLSMKVIEMLPSWRFWKALRFERLLFRAGSGCCRTAFADAPRLNRVRVEIGRS